MNILVLIFEINNSYNDSDFISHKNATPLVTTVDVTTFSFQLSVLISSFFKAKIKF